MRGLVGAARVAPRAPGPEGHLPQGCEGRRGQGGEPAGPGHPVFGAESGHRHHPGVLPTSGFRV